MSVVGLLTLQLHIEHAHSLKEKRHVLKGLKDRLRNRFNVSVAEVDGQDTWQASVVAVVMVSRDRQRVQNQLAKAESEAERFLGADLIGREVEFL
ncbi:MAG: DUF503 domain-containing protein [Bryobacterales bacterium]|jgi:uncharacterized protein YlxP (DUF503 family)|nr:DUF503 domain-containing protein [Bryobacterales bacterium]MDE0294760.1 DUF503 domain-containing protein [Bryobacterales bacterium]MDE0434545.1 DUF503 domain-containing protein [Bryobacterales bacterium]